MSQREEEKLYPAFGFAIQPQQPLYRPTPPGARPKVWMVSFGGENGTDTTCGIIMTEGIFFRTGGFGYNLSAEHAGQAYSWLFKFLCLLARQRPKHAGFPIHRRGGRQS
jgi:hypothetical protein